MNNICLFQYVRFGKNAQEPPSSRIPDIVDINSSVIPPMPSISSLSNIFKVQSITTTTNTTTITVASSKLITTNSLMPPRVSKIIKFSTRILF